MLGIMMIAATLLFSQVTDDVVLSYKWADATGNPAGYEMQLSYDNGTTWLIIGDADFANDGSGESRMSLTVKGGVEHVVRVRAFGNGSVAGNKAFFGPWSLSSTPLTPPNFGVPGIPVFEVQIIVNVTTAEAP